jgi:excinuclease ABC subunit A
VVAAGPPTEVLANPASITAQYLSGVREIAVPKTRRTGNGHALRIVGARQNNLKNVTVDVPLGKFVCATGVSGSGKSSLVNDILLEALQASGRRESAGEVENGEEEDDAPHEIGAHDRIDGTSHIDKVIAIDQAPIGRTPRSNPATYIKVFDEIRSLYAQMPEAKLRGYQPGRFSFNKPGGRCEACEGNGSNRLEMDFLADVWVTCPVCEGRRFNRETLQVVYRGKAIHEVLDLEVAQALEHFVHVPKIRDRLQTLHDVGLDYIKLGQPSPTLSGGEAQRVKLAKELCRRSTGKTLYVLDEPTTGLHFEDVKKLLEVLHNFVEQGNTVLVIEHNLDVIKTADWVIDLGPEGGAGGGEVVAVGTPEQIAQAKRSYTGQALAPVLLPKKRIKATGRKPREKTPKAKDNGFITHLEVQGARQHNLKNVDARLPRERMSVFCGPSGSGKSSLAMDTIYAEGQRRYVESLSSYARQFLGQVQKPKVEHITGLSPAIAIEQKTTSKSPRSTVGTVTEIYDYLRILYARIGVRHCPHDGTPISTQTADQIIEKILSLPEGTKLYVMAPLERKGQERYDALFDEIRRAGFIRMRVDGKSYAVDEPPAIDHRRKHVVEVVVDRNVVRPGTRTRIADAVEQALDLGRGVIHLAFVDADQDEPQWRVERYSQHLACSACGRSYEQLAPHNYSFNSPLGWCPTCEGLGVQKGANVNLLIRDDSLSPREGAVAAWPELTKGSPFLPFAEALAKHAGFSLDSPYRDLDPRHQRVILQGSGEDLIPLGPRSAHRFQYKGLFPAIDEASRVSFVYRSRLDHLVDEVPCPACGGSRLRADAAATRFQGQMLRELCARPLGATARFFDDLRLAKRDREIVGDVLRELVSRIKFLVDVGLDYLSLDRKGPTLSGGEAQRIRLASQIGSGLTGVLYVLDEPTIGLHPRDNARLLAALHRLRDLGNTLILVEHDREVIASADHLLDFGPGAGDRGGEITAAGPPAQIVKSKVSLTGQYLSGRLAIPVPTNRRIESNGFEGEPTPNVIRTLSPVGKALSILGARQHNLKNIDVHIPLGTLVAVTGVSGSGKSSLINEVLYNTLARKLHRAQTPGAAHDEIAGLENVDKIINVDQDPIGNSPSSNPATYTGVFDLVRELFARLPESKVRGYHPRRFSFNQKGGRCEACEGNGQKRIEMHFLPDVWVECDVCHGKRYNPETLAVQYKGKSIADVLDMRIGQALELFGNIPKIHRILKTLADVGLDYMALGQPAPTMSGGEAQRVKLAAELARPGTGKTLYLLDEPTTGLHFDDVKKLLDVLHRLADLGNTVIVVEHNVDVIKTADWVIDLGPEPGFEGGRIVAQGTPEDVVRQAMQPGVVSHTGRILRAVLEAGPHAERTPYDPKAELAKAEGGLDIADVGRDARLPWEEDGRRWHTRDRVTTKGTAIKWDGEALAWVIDQIQKLGTFAGTNWNHRTIVEVTAPKKSQGWFLHAMTGHEAYLKLVFRMPGKPFKQELLASQLALKPLSDTPGLEGYSRDANRVEVGNWPGQQYVVIIVNKKAEIDTPAFRAFLKTAVGQFQSGLKAEENPVEAAMPWKKDGEKWHLSVKGFPPGRKMRWDHRILVQLVAILKEVGPDLEFKWDVRDAITVRPPGSSRMWARLKTKDPQALEVWFVGAPGQMNLGRAERFGIQPEIDSDRTDGTDVLKLRFQTLTQLLPAELKKLLIEHLAGFRKALVES